MSLDQIVSVSISRDVKTVSRVGFGVPLILGSNATFVERIRSYSDIAAVLVDFAATTAEHKAASSIFAQNPRPPIIKIGRVGVAIKMKVNIEPTTVVDSTLYKVTINGTDFDFTSGVGTSATLIVTGLLAAIAGGSEPVTTTDNTTDFDIEADVAGVDFQISVNANQTLLSTSIYSEDVSDALALIRDEDDDFYFVLMTSRTDSEIKDLSAAIELLTKFYMGATFDTDTLLVTETDVIGVLKGLNVDKTAILYSTENLTYPEAGWVGLMSPKDPGSVTWKFKTIVGSVATNLTDTQKGNLKGKNGNIFNTVGGVDITEEGVVSSGEFIDIIRGTAFIEVNIQADVFQGLVSVDKVPFTNAGIDVVKNLVLAVLNAAVDSGILTDNPGPVVTAPDVSEISTADKAARFLDNVEFTAVFSGAIHKTTITGIISV